MINCLTEVQVVAVGIVGGSDLTKITEQLGKTGVYFFLVDSIKIKLEMY